MIPSRAVAAWASVLLLLAGAARAAPKPGHWRLRLGLDLVHDSNVLELSDKERAEVGDPARADRHGLASADDLVLEPDVEISYTKNVFARRATTVAMDVGGALHDRNGRLDSVSFGLDWEQELGKTRRDSMSRVGLSLSHAPEITLKRITDDDETLAQGRSVRADQELAKDVLRLDGTVELVPKRMALELAVDREWRDFIPTFDERDARTDGWRARLVGWPAERWRLRGWYRGESHEAVGDDPATPLAEDDLSSRRDITGLDVRFEWGKASARQRVQAAWEEERRSYTAASPFDFYHHSRRDRRASWSASWRRSLPRRLSVEVSVDREVNDSTFAVPPPTASDPGDTTSWDRTRIGASLGWRTDLGRRKRAR